MVQVRVGGVALDAAGQHVLLLKPLDMPPGEGRILPVWIGALEATSILVAVEGAEVPRPLAHDLMGDILRSLGGELERAEVTRIDDGTYYAQLTVRSPVGVRLVDARPSDAVALASRLSAPIWVADDVMEEAGVSDILESGGESDEQVDEAPPEEKLDEFRRFLEDVDPEDFRE